MELSRLSLKPLPPAARPAGALLSALGVALVLAVALGLSSLPRGAYGDLTFAEMTPYLGWAIAAGLAYLGGVWVVRFRTSTRAALPIILLAGLAARLLVLVHPPVLSTDLYRYVWDGRVQVAGINPYRYIPADPALLPLRDTPAAPQAPAHTATATDIYANINRADFAPTIYPPAAQALFALLGQVASSIWGIKTAMLAFDLATTGIVLLILRDAARPAAHVLIWAWNPLVIWEFAGAGHIDAMATAFVALAVLLAIRARTGWAGLALGVAISTKLLPAVFFPAIWRRWNLAGPLAAAAVVALGYAAYSSVGLKVFGFLTGYTQEEKLQEGGGFLLLRLLALGGPLPPWAGRAYVVAAMALLGGLALWIVRSPLPTAMSARATVIGDAALLLAAALIALLSPHYPWYLTMLVLPAVLRPSWTALGVTVTAPLLYRDFSLYYLSWTAAAYLIPLPLLLIDLRRPRPTPALLAQGGS